jgi:hypothetical protein
VRGRYPAQNPVTACITLFTDQTLFPGKGCKLCVCDRRPESIFKDPTRHVQTQTSLPHFASIPSVPFSDPYFGTKHPSKPSYHTRPRHKSAAKTQTAYPSDSIKLPKTWSSRMSGSSGEAWGTALLVIWKAYPHRYSRCARIVNARTPAAHNIAQ